MPALFDCESFSWHRGGGGERGGEEEERGRKLWSVLRPLARIYYCLCPFVRVAILCVLFCFATLCLSVCLILCVCGGVAHIIALVAWREVSLFLSTCWMFLARLAISFTLFFSRRRIVCLDLSNCALRNGRFGVAGRAQHRFFFSILLQSLGTGRSFLSRLFWSAFGERRDPQFGRSWLSSKNFSGKEDEELIFFMQLASQVANYWGSFRETDIRLQALIIAKKDWKGLPGRP